MAKKEAPKVPDLEKIVGGIGSGGAAGNDRHDNAEKQVKAAIVKIQGFLQELVDYIKERETE